MPTICSLTLNSESYKEALDILIDRYGNPQVLIDRYGNPQVLIDRYGNSQVLISAHMEKSQN